jgi:glutamyl-Q tRNA(Asp) synthetase
MKPAAAVGRFAPSPTGPLHLGSLVAAVGSWLFARHAGGRWLVRMEDLDAPRVVPGAADEILAALDRYGMRPDEAPVFQSQRLARYEGALEQLRARGAVYDCGCSRGDLRRLASAPAVADVLEDAAAAVRSGGQTGESAHGGEPEPRVYPGTCRHGLPAGRVARAVRLLVPPGDVAFVDRVHGALVEEVATAVGDFVLRRADGVFAYQLAVVVDDAAQGVTEVVRGADLLDSTARQIALQRALGLPTPAYAHLPLVLAPDGSKLGKRDGALPLPALDERRVRATLGAALRALGVEGVADSTPEAMLAAARERFDPRAIPRGPLPMPT